MNTSSRPLAGALLVLLLLGGCDNSGAPTSQQRYAIRGLYSAALSQDSQFALIGAQQEGGSLWKIADNARQYDWNHSATERSLINHVAFAPSGDLAATATQQELVLWHTATGQAEWFWRAPAEILALAISDHGQQALLGLANHQAILFDSLRGGITQTFNHQARVRSVAISHDGQQILTGADNYQATLWDSHSGSTVHQHTFANVVDTVALSPDGSLAFASASLDQAIIWDTRTGQVRHYLSGNEGLFKRRVSYLSARFAPTSKQLLTGTASGLVQLWDVDSGQVIKHWRLAKHHAYGPTSTSVLAVGFKPGGGYYAIGANGLLNQFN